MVLRQEAAVAGMALLALMAMLLIAVMKGIAEEIAKLLERPAEQLEKSPSGAD